MRQLGRAALGRIQDVYDYYISPYEFALGIRNFFSNHTEVAECPSPLQPDGAKAPCHLMDGL